MNLRKTQRQISQWIGNYLTYNRSEQRGIAVLSLVLLGVIIFQVLIPAETFQKPPDFRLFASGIDSFEASWKRAADSDSVARINRYIKYRSKPAGWHFDTVSAKSGIRKPPLVVDLNRADTFELQQLRGIGPAFARRIVAYRDRLRGFHDVGQLLEVFGMDTARYAMIEANLTVTRDSVHPIDLNAVTFKELLRHPYFPFAITKGIMIYRQKNKRFADIGELRKIDGVNDSLFRRMIIYLRIGP
ncbi:MAG: helix-hairpin-helix domain-containing protein [Bacteroidota bacterium]